MIKVYHVFTQDGLCIDSIEATCDALAIAAACRKYAGYVSVKPANGVADGTADIPILTQEDIRFKAIVGDHDELADHQVQAGIDYWCGMGELLEQAGPVMELARDECNRVGNILIDIRTSRSK